MLIGHVLRSLSNYWKQNVEELLSLPIHNIQPNLKVSIPLQMEAIKVPEWANDCGVNGQLMVPRECLESGFSGVDWKKVDWWTAIFLLMEGWHERIWEKTHGVIHSYSFKLKDWDTRAWDHAWVNRIALFLRKWFLLHFDKRESFLGELPKSNFILSHDVDAVSKTLPIRLKQTAFNLFNSLRCLSNGSLANSIKKCGKSFRMLFGKEDWWVFEKLLEMEREFEIKAIYNFYADARPKNFKRWLMDPSYDVSTDRLKSLLVKLRNDGHEVGLHPTFDAWSDSNLLNDQKLLLEESLGSKVKTCRQHWLRFSWSKTWKAQFRAGIERDSTLMFNDRPGFRNSAALSWNPWDPETSKIHVMKSVNSLIMDSHLYDYQSFSSKERSDQIKRWTNECRSVHGECSLLWHPHTLTNDYGWEQGFKILLQSSSL